MLGFFENEYVNVSPGIYRPKAVDNQGAAYLTNPGNDYGPVATSKTGTISLWINPQGTWNSPGSTRIMRFVKPGTTSSMELITTTSGRLSINVRNSSGTIIFTGQTPNDTFVVNLWQHILISWNLETSTYHFYVNDAPIALNQLTMINDFASDFNQVEVFGQSSAQFDGWISDVFADTYYRDFLVTENRRSFINEDGYAVNISGYGHPHLHLTGDKDTFMSNQGYGGDLTLTNGSLINAEYAPVGEPFRYKPKAIDFNQAGYMVNTGYTGVIPDNLKGTISLWAYHEHTTWSDSARLFDYRTGGGTTRLEIRNSGSGRMVFTAMEPDGTIFLSMHMPNDTFQPNKWYHILISWDGTTGKGHFVINGKLQTEYFGTPVFAITSNPTAIGRVAVPYNYNSRWWIADYYADYRYIDLTIQSNIDKFITQNGEAVDLSNYGNPHLLLTGDKDNININRGTGPDLNFSGGPFLNAPTAPIGQAYPYRPNAVSPHYNMYESPSYNSEGVTLDKGTLSFWYYMNQDSWPGGTGDAFSLRNGGGTYTCRVYYTSQNRLVISLSGNNGGGGYTFVSPTNSVTLKKWHHFLMSWDNSIGYLKVFMNDVQRASTTSMPVTDGSGASIGRFEIVSSGRTVDRVWLSDIYFDNVYRDLGIESHRRQFIDKNKLPVAPNPEFGPWALFNGDENDLWINRGFAQNLPAPYDYLLNADFPPGANKPGLNYWNGSNWVSGTMKRWNGHDWYEGSLKYWDDSWKEYIAPANKPRTQRYIQSYAFPATSPEWSPSANYTMPPNITNGNTLLLLVATGGTGNDHNVQITGWEEVGHWKTDANTTQGNMHIFKKIANGDSNAPLTMTANTSTGWATILYELELPLSEIELSLSSTVSPFTTDPPLHTPSTGNKRYIWIAASFMERSTGSASAAPTDYSVLENARSTVTGNTSGQHCSIASAYRIVSASSEDPSDFTWNVPYDCGAVTISCR